MELTVDRKYKKEEYTIGNLYINGEYFCDTLEDKVRLLNAYEDKIYGETAIPMGRYKVILTYSPHFERILPEIINVTFFKDIRIHNGNTKEHTKGCILVGLNKAVGKVLYSKKTLDKLMTILQQAVDNNEEIFINIK